MSTFVTSTSSGVHIHIESDIKLTIHSASDDSSWILQYDNMTIGVRIFKTSAEFFQLGLPTHSTSTQRRWCAIGNPSIYISDMSNPKILWDGCSFGSSSSIAGKANIKFYIPPQHYINVTASVSTRSTIKDSPTVSKTSIPSPHMIQSILNHGGSISKGYRLDSPSNPVSVRYENLNIKGNFDGSVKDPNGHGAKVEMKNVRVQGKINGSAISFGGGASVHITGCVIGDDISCPAIDYGNTEEQKKKTREITDLTNPNR